MASKPKTKTFYVLRRGMCSLGYYTRLAGYRVGARNEKEAITLVKELAGKHAKLKAHLDNRSESVAHGEVIEEFNEKRFHTLKQNRYKGANRMSEQEQVVMTAGELRELKVWTEVCKRNRWNVESMERMISDDMRFHVDADLLGSVTNFIIVKEGLYLESFDKETEKCTWTELEEEAMVFMNLEPPAIQKSFRNTGHGSVTGRLV